MTDEEREAEIRDLAKDPRETAVRFLLAQLDGARAERDAERSQRVRLTSDLVNADRERDAALARVKVLEGVLRMTAKCLDDLAPWSPEVTEGCAAISVIAHEALKPEGGGP